LALTLFESDGARRIHDEIRRRVGDKAFRTWFEGVELLPRPGDQLEVHVPTSFHRAFLGDRYQTLISDSAAAVLGGRSYELLFVAPPHVGAVTTPEVESPTPAPPHSQPFDLDGFVVGGANRLALNAARAVAERPGTDYNPLFIHGGVGQGKTHLLSAIATHYRSLGWSSVISVSCARFTDDFIKAIASQKILEFRRRLRDADALLIDDVQFLAMKSKTQEEFFHTFNTLINLGRQVVLSADCAPGELPGIEKRLASRFGAGLVADLGSPDTETRMEILRRKGEELDLVLSSEICGEVAGVVRGSARELAGVAKRLHSVIHLEKRPLDLESTRGVLSELYGSMAPSIDLDRIDQGVCEEFDVSRVELHSKKRTRSIVVPRQIAMFLARRHTSASLKEIGHHFGGRDHTTVIHAVEKIQSLNRSDRTFRRRIEAVEKMLLR